ncbi:MAG: hypothetical protein PHW64_03695 [Sulfuricurvum sp.]|nr:hypothetical protein [Sulfuricurvum sp.]
MADTLYLKKKKEAELKGALSEKITISLTEKEMEILKRKADDFAQTPEETLRDYILQGAAFDASVFEEKKKKTSGKKMKAEGKINECF